ncbi:tRNA synthetases class II-domain-containing protein [Lipomyces kononenkoae]|uniref:tRNA synthetases class II-domain-containing protein n=1 Tax=Lipomyces kononenkoae TaxID=34357 RepID=A0ACC3T742_LIPKO
MHLHQGLRHILKRRLILFRFCEYGRSYSHNSIEGVSRLARRDEIVKFTERFDFPKATHTIWQLYREASFQMQLREGATPKVVLHGWIDSPPRKVSRTRAFANLRDVQFLYRTVEQVEKQKHEASDEEVATIQLFEDLTERSSDIDNPSVTLLRRMKQETCVCVEGYVCKSKGNISWRLEVVVDRITVLNSAEDLVSQMRGAKDWDPKYRYLQLRSFRLQRALAMRSRVAGLIRNTLEGHRFTEVETPLLFRSTPEGAREFLVPSRTEPGKMYALPQSPQQYKQLLMASGVHRYYQFAKCFRDEDLRKDRQPEFTQVDLEMAFAKASDVQDIVEAILVQVWKEIKGIELQQPLKRLRYMEAMSRYGIDKPDLRSSMEIHDLSDFATSTTDPDYPVFEILVLRPEDSKFPPAVFAPDGSPSLRTPLCHRIKLSNEGPSKWLSESVAKFDLELVADLETTANQIMQKFDIRDGDVVYSCTRQRVPFENPTPLGRQRLFIMQETMNLSEKLDAALWVVEFPLFTPTATGRVVNGYIEYDYSRLVATHHPFTMPCLESLPAVLDAGEDQSSRIDARTIFGQHYDIVVNGVEVGGGSTRIHDSGLQRLVLSRILHVSGIRPSNLEPGEAEPENPFTHLLNALSMACPPHAGLALGFDRLCAMLNGSDSIREVIAFPKTQTGSDPLVDSPSRVTDEQLGVYHVQLRK